MGDESFGHNGTLRRSECSEFRGGGGDCAEAALGDMALAERIETETVGIKRLECEA